MENEYQREQGLPGISEVAGVGLACNFAVLGLWHFSHTLQTFGL